MLGADVEPICGHCCSSSAAEAPSQPHEFAWRRCSTAAAGWFYGAPGILWGNRHHVHPNGALPSGSMGLQLSFGTPGNTLTLMGLFQVVLWGTKYQAHPNGSLGTLATLPCISLPIFELLQQPRPKQTCGAISCTRLELSTPALRSQISAPLGRRLQVGASSVPALRAALGQAL